MEDYASKDKTESSLAKGTYNEREYRSAVDL